jgi:asparagine N-glycosylation enzyme membrane subunit Stt3
MPILTIVLALAVVLTIDDWRYRRKGGKKPTRGEKSFLLVAILTLVVLEVLGFWLISNVPDPGAAGRAAHGIGRLSAIVLTLFFFGWQVRRWRIRRANPLPSARGVGGDRRTS